MSEKETKIIVYRGSPGIIAGILACFFGLLGIFTFGLIFVPLAALCSLIGLIRGTNRFGLPGFTVSLIGAVLTIVGIFTSPTILLLLGISFVSADRADSNPAKNSLVSCGSGGCFPIDDSAESRAAAKAANDYNAREATRIRSQLPVK